MFDGVFLYDHLDSGHCSADHVLWILHDSVAAAFPHGTWFLWLCYCKGLGRKRGASRFSVPGGLRARIFLKRVHGSEILAFLKIIMGGKLFISPSLLHVKKERGARAARAPHVAILGIGSGLRLAWGRILAPGNV